MEGGGIVCDAVLSSCVDRNDKVGSEAIRTSSLRAEPSGGSCLGGFGIWMGGSGVRVFSAASRAD